MQRNYIGVYIEQEVTTVRRKLYTPLRTRLQKKCALVSRLQTS